MYLLRNERSKEVARMGCREPWNKEEQDQVESEFADDLDGFEKGKLEGFLLVPQPCKEDGGYGIQGKDSAHIDNHL